MASYDYLNFVHYTVQNSRIGYHLPSFFKTYVTYNKTENMIRVSAEISFTSRIMLDSTVGIRLTRPIKIAGCPIHFCTPFVNSLSDKPLQKVGTKSYPNIRPAPIPIFNP